MKEKVDCFRKRLVKKNHILQLVHRLNLCLELESEKEIVYLHFQKHTIISSDNKCSTAEQHVRLTGQREQIDYLLDGKIKLREAVQLGYLAIECPFRIMLVLESIFHLAKSQPDEILV